MYIWAISQKKLCLICSGFTVVDPPLPDLQGCFIGDISREIFASFVMLTAFEFGERDPWTVNHSS
jgi:hypothetical protein